MSKENTMLAHWYCDITEVRPLSHNCFKYYESKLKQGLLVDYSFDL